MAKLSVWLTFGALALSAACAGSQSKASSASAELPEERLSAESDAPAIFLDAKPSAPAIGYLGKDVRVEVAGPQANGRVPVRVRGALLVRGYVPENLLTLRTQRHGRLRGTPVYLGPNDPVTVLGPGEKPGRVLVRAVPRVGALSLPVFEGTFPTVGLAAQAATEAARPPEGAPYELPAGSALALYDKPNGKVVAELPATTAPLPLRVLSAKGGWSALRIGSGPHLVGYTNAALVPAAEAPMVAAETNMQANESAGLPRRLLQEGGELRRIAAGARVSFGGNVIAKLQKPGYARVLATYPSGEVDALVAVDDEVAVRGLVRALDLTPVDVGRPAVQ